MGNHWPRGDGGCLCEDPTRPRRTENAFYDTRYSMDGKTRSMPRQDPGSSADSQPGTSRSAWKTRRPFFSATPTICGRREKRKRVRFHCARVGRHAGRIVAGARAVGSGHQDHEAVFFATGAGHWVAIDELVTRTP